MRRSAKLQTEPTMTDKSDDYTAPGWRYSDFLATCTLAASLIAAWLYIAGWRYADQYFSRFGIGLGEIDLPVQYFMIYGFWVARYNIIYVMLFLAVAIISVLTVKAPIISPTARYVSALCCIIVAITLSFIGGYFLADVTANNMLSEAADHDFPGVPRVRLLTKTTSSPTQLVSADTLQSGCLRTPTPE